MARRSMEPTEIEPYQVLLNSDQVTRLYLDELGDVAERPLGVAIIKLVVETKKRTPELARQLVEKARSELADEVVQQQVLDLIETIVLYKLPQIGRKELAKMFTRDDLKKTRYYWEVREEVREELQQEVREELQQEVREELQQEVQQQVQQQVREATLELIGRWLRRFIGTVNPQLQERIHQLSVVELENLAEALLDFSTEADLAAWLDENSNQSDEE